MASSLPSSVSPADLRIKFKNRPYKLDLIETSPIHKLTLLDWTAQLSVSENKLVRKLSYRNASISNLYQILGFFFVFEGIIITAVAQTANDNNTCRNSWIFFILSLIASVATLCASIQQAREFTNADKSYFEEKDLCSALSASIQQLKEQGTDFDVVKGQPTVIAKQSWDSGGFNGFYENWVWSYVGAVFAVIVLFYGATLVAIKMMSCRHS